MKIRLLMIAAFLFAAGSASAFEVYNHFLYERITYPGTAIPEFGPKMQEEVFDWSDATLVSHSVDFPDLGLKAYGSAEMLLDSSPSNYSTIIPTNQVDFSTKILTAGVSWEIFPGFFAELGKKCIRTGNGYFRSPTDFLGYSNSAISTSSTTAQEKLAEGLIGADLEYLGGFADFHEFFSPWLDWNPTNCPDLQYLQTPQKNWQNLFTVGFRIFDSDWLAITHTAWDTNGRPLTSFGLNGSESVGDSLVLYGAAAIQERVSNTYVSNTTNFALADREVPWVPSAIAGVTYSLTANDTITVEYNYNGRGLAGQEYADGIAYMTNRAAQAVIPAGSRNLFGEYGLFNAARHYLFERYAKNYPDQKASLEVLNLNNLQDGSGMASLALTWSPDVCNLTARLQTFYGIPASEVGTAGVLWETSIEAELFVF
jgi:hypothetical protein